MLLIIPILLLIIFAPAAMMVVGWVRRGIAYQWLIAASSLVAVWGYMLFLGSRLPLEAQIPTWQPLALFPTTPAFLLDRVSWLFSIGVVTLALAVILTAVARLTVGSWQPWAGTLALCGLSLLAVAAGNPLMLLLAWAAFDLVDVLIVLVQVKESLGRERAVFSLTARISGMALLLWALVLARAQGDALNFQSIPAIVSPYLLLAAGLRLGVIPLQAPLLESQTLRRGLGTALRLLPAASSLMLLVRAANAGIPPALAGFFIVPTAIAALYSSLSWLLSSDTLSARPFWILGIAAFAVASAVEGDAQAAQAWGLVLLFGGSYIFLLAPAHRRLLPLGILSLIGVSALPFSLTWAGLGMYANSSTGIVGLIRWAACVLFFLSHTFILLGYIRHSLRVPLDQAQLERWAWLVYPLGLGLPVLASLGLGWINRPDLRELPWMYWLLGFFTLAAAVGLWVWNERGPSSPPVPASLQRGSGWSTTLWANLLSLTWLYRFAWVIYQGLGRVLGLLTQILEGDGGLIWAFVLLGLLWSLFHG